MAETKATEATSKGAKVVANGRKRPAMQTEAAWLHEREPKAIARDSGYALASIAHDAVEFVRAVPARVDTWREEAPSSAKELRQDVPVRARSLSGTMQERLSSQRSEFEQQMRSLRDRTRGELEGRLHQAETRFDEKVVEGEQVVAEVRDDPRVNRIESELAKVWEQASNTQSQTKAAWTSVRKTVDVAVEAGREQARNARSQVKAALTSARKTAETAAEAGDTVVDVAGESTS